MKRDETDEEQTLYNITEMAEMLGYDRATLSKKITKKWDLKPAKKNADGYRCWSISDFELIRERLLGHKDNKSPALPSPAAPPVAEPLPRPTDTSPAAIAAAIAAANGEQNSAPVWASEFINKPRAKWTPEDHAADAARIRMNKIAEDDKLNEAQAILDHREIEAWESKRK